MSDIYDEAVDYLTEHPDEILECWNNPYRMRAGILFTHVSARASIDVEFMRCGCLTQVAMERDLDDPSYRADTNALTDAIRADASIPKHPEDIQAADLTTFARWQRRIDKDLGRRWEWLEIEYVDDDPDTRPRDLEPDAIWVNTNRPTPRSYDLQENGKLRKL